MVVKSTTSPLLLLICLHFVIIQYSDGSIDNKSKTHNGGTYFNYIVDGEGEETSGFSKRIWGLRQSNTVPNLISVFNAPNIPTSSFSWNTCGDANDSVQIISLSVVQSKALLFQIDGSGKVTQDVNSPVKGRLKLSKKMLWGWTPLPCLDGFGSCDYVDLCAMSPCISPQAESKNIPCSCPIKQGSYNGSLEFDLSTIKVPKWLEKGHYWAQANIGESPQVLCIEIDITVV